MRGRELFLITCSGGTGVGAGEGTASGVEGNPEGVEAVEEGCWMEWSGTEGGGTSVPFLALAGSGFSGESPSIPVRRTGLTSSGPW